MNVQSPPDSLYLPATYWASGQVRLPGSKSISNRALLLAALASGETEIHGLLASDDTEVMLGALTTLGVDIEQRAAGQYRVRGCGGNFPVREADLFLGNAGTAYRSLTAVLALAGGHYRLSGVARMHERPIGDLVAALTCLGADIRCSGRAGYPPLEIFPPKPGGDGPRRASVRGDVSSQFLSALLMALPIEGQAAEIDVVGELISRPYVEITLNLLARFGVSWQREGWRKFSLAAGQAYRAAGSFAVEADASSASYFLAAGAIAGGPVTVHGVGQGSIQGDVAFAETLSAMGAAVEMGADHITVRAPAAGRLRAIDADFNHMPDAAMTVAMLALFADGVSCLRNIGSWRVKETDRIAAMATEMRKLGAGVEEGADYLRITPPAELTANARIDTYDSLARHTFSPDPPTMARDNPFRSCQADAVTFNVGSG